MPISVDDIRFFHSGGASNTLSPASLGGVKSNTRVISQSAAFLTSTITGVSVLAANNNSQGNGTLGYNSTNQTLSWQPPGSLYTYGTVLVANGSLSVGGSDGMLFVTIVFASLPVSTKTDTLQITNAMAAVFPTVSAGNSLAGLIQYRCLYVYNNHPSLTANALKVFVAQATTGPDEIYIGLDPAGVGNGSTTGVATVVALDTTPPTGVTFSNPLSSTTGLLAGNLGPGQSFAFWEKRVVLPNSVGYLDINTFKVGIALTS